MRLAKVLIAGILTFGLSMNLCAQTPDTLHLSLKDCIDWGHTQSPAAKMAKNSFNSDYWSYRAFEARYFPQLSFTANAPGLVRAINSIPQPDGTVQFRAQSQSSSTIGLSLSQNIPLTGGQILLTSGITRIDLFGATNSYLWQSTPFVLGISQPIFQFNSQRWNRKVESVRFRSAERQYTEQQADIAVDITQKFFAVYIAKMNLETAHFNVSINDTIFTISQGRFNVGKIAENDLLQSELALMNARSNLERAQLQLEQSQEELVIALGLPRNTIIEPVVPTQITPVSVPPNKALELAKSNRSDILDLKVNKLQAEMNLAQAKSDAGLSSRIIARVGYNKSADTFTDLYVDPRDQEYFNVEFDLPIFQWGQNKAQIEAAQANLDRQQQLNELALRQFEQEVRYQAKEFALLQEQVSIAARADTVAVRRFDVTKNRYLIGKIDITNILIAQNERDNARRNFITTLRDYWRTYYQIQRLTLYNFIENKPLRRDMYE